MTFKSKFWTVFTFYVVHKYILFEIPGSTWHLSSLIVLWYSIFLSVLAFKIMMKYWFCSKMWNFRCRVWVLKFSSESNISARHLKFSDFIKDFQSKNKKFQVSSGYVQLDTWNFLSSTSEIFCWLKKERSFRNFVWVKWYNFNELKLFGAWTYINTDYRLHEQSPWSLEPFYAFAPWAAGKTFQRSRRPPILEAFAAQQ